MNFKQRITNAVYGQAVCDAVGNPFEFYSEVKPEDVIEYANNTSVLVITDDTQMLLFGFEAIYNLDLYHGNLFDQVRKSFTQSYVDWYYTQTHGKNEFHLTANGLLEYRSMYSIQAPGNTCMGACYALKNNESVLNKSMGCGSVMRLLPLICLFDNEKYTIEYSDIIDCAKITGNITHKHRLNDAAIDKYMHTAYKIFNGFKVGCIDTRNISDIGEGWIAPEAVDMAIWAYCNAESFDDLLRLSISHAGDSDSVGAIAGSLWGLSGREVPKKYIDKLDAIDAIKYIIEDTISTTTL